MTDHDAARLQELVNENTRAGFSNVTVPCDALEQSLENLRLSRQTLLRLVDRLHSGGEVPDFDIRNPADRQAYDAACAFLWPAESLLDAAARPHDASFVSRQMHDELVSFVRVLGEETAAAGLPAGDRTVVLANVRELIAACARHVTAYDEVARRVAATEAVLAFYADLDSWRWKTRYDGSSTRISCGVIDFEAPIGKSLPPALLDYGEQARATLRPAEEPR